MALKIEEQIEVLKTAKEIYAKDVWYGLCGCIIESLTKHDFNTNYVGGGCIDERYGVIIKKAIPSFNFTALTKAGKKGLSPETLIVESQKKHSSFWWSPDDRTIRPKVIDYLISELEKKL